MKAKHDPELIKILFDRSQVENEKSFEASKSMANILNVLSDKFTPMAIDKFINDVQPFETIRQYYADIYQVILNEIDPKDYDKIISCFNRVKVEFSTPQHDKSKTKVINQYHVEFIQNLISKLEADKKLNTNISTQPEDKKVPDKYFAALHLILILLGKEPQIGNKSKNEIIDLGKNKYRTGQGFYREIRNIDLLNMTAFIRSLPDKDRSKWKETIITISGNDADVISWINKQPK